MKLYLMGSLRNPEIVKVGNAIRELGFDVYDDWFAAGERADDSWMEYEKARGRTHKEALEGYAATQIFEWDVKHLNESEVGVLLMPAGKSAHAELGYIARGGFATFVYFPDNAPEPERWEVMSKFGKACFGWDELRAELELLLPPDDINDEMPF